MNGALVIVTVLFIISNFFTASLIVKYAIVVNLQRLRLYPCNLSPIVQLNYPDQIFALSERIVAVESL